MTVQKLIDLLLTKERDAEVRLHHKFGEAVMFCLAEKDNNGCIWLTTASDTDLKSELKARFEEAIDSGIDESEFYFDLLESGFTIEMVEEHMGKETAEHMNFVCYEYGLI